jgi:hypothetical protein
MSAMLRYVFFFGIVVLAMVGLVSCARGSSSCYAFSGWRGGVHRMPCGPAGRDPSVSVEVDGGGLEAATN